MFKLDLVYNVGNKLKKAKKIVGGIKTNRLLLLMKNDIIKPYDNL